VLSVIHSNATVFSDPMKQHQRHIQYTLYVQISLLQISERKFVV